MKPQTTDSHCSEKPVRFVLKKPWPDFLTFYSSATGAGWVVPKKYVQEVGEEVADRARVAGAARAPASEGRRRPMKKTLASSLLVLVCATWQPLPGLLYAQRGWLAIVHLGLVATGAALLITAELASHVRRTAVRV